MSRVNLNVSGTKFEIDPRCLEKEPFQKLPRLVFDARKDGNEQELSIDRPSDSFAAILTYYQTGELHIPTGVCPGAFRKELEYWEIGADNLSECCIFRYFAFFAEQDTLKQFCQTVLRDRNNVMFETSPHVPVRSCNSFRNFRRRMWNIVDNNESSVWAKLYFCGIFLLVLLSIFILAYGTEPMFQRKLTKCELIEYYRSTQNPDIDKVMKYIGNPDCSRQDDNDFVPFDQEEIMYYYYYYDETKDGLGANTTSTPSPNSSTHAVPLSTSTFNSTVSNLSASDPALSPFQLPPQKQKEKIHIPYFMIQNRAFDVLEKITLALFSVDFILRIFSCPSIPRYFLSPINFVDCIALLGTYIHFIVISVEKEQRYLDSWLDITMYFQILRTFRLFRVVKNVRAAKVLVYSVKQSLRDLLILVMFLVIAVCSFASIVYLAEDRSDFQSIPTGWWWALVTLTTVGYGDVYPKTPAGRFIGSLCAISGVVLIALTLPIFVNNFITLYNYAEVDERLQRNAKLNKRFGGHGQAAATGAVKEALNEEVITEEEKADKRLHMTE